MQTKIYFIIYISSATRPFSKNELLELLAKCRENNIQLNITGMLLFKAGFFQQILEGPEDVVKSLYAKIQKDPRHRGVIKAFEGYENERQFSEWSMGFYDLNSAEAADIPGYSPYLNTPLSDEQFMSNLGICRRFMLMFKKYGAK